jgi:hypothetical protein
MSDNAKQVNVRFEGPALDQLKKLTEATGKNLSDVLREAVNTSYWLHQQKSAGKRILIQDTDQENSLREVILR